MYKKIWRVFRLFYFFIAILVWKQAAADTVTDYINCYGKISSYSSGVNYLLERDEGFILPTENGFDVFTRNRPGAGRSQSYKLPKAPSPLQSAGEPGRTAYFLKLAVPGSSASFNYLTYALTPDQAPEVVLSLKPINPPGEQEYVVLENGPTEEGAFSRARADLVKRIGAIPNFKNKKEERARAEQIGKLRELGNEKLIALINEGNEQAVKKLASAIDACNAIQDSEITAALRRAVEELGDYLPAKLRKGTHSPQ